MIERCTDYRRVKALTGYIVCPSPEVFYLVETDGIDDLGVVWFHTCDGGHMVHVQMGDMMRGKKAAQSINDAFEWMFENTACEKIIGEIPIERRAVHFMAKHVGFKFDGIDKGVLRCYSLTKITFNKRAA